LNESIEKVISEPGGWWSIVQWLVDHRPLLIRIVLALAAMLVLRAAVRAVLRRIRRSRPPRIHPRLAKYNIDAVELDRHRRQLAQKILATSTGSRLAGYRIVRQVEALFVDGFRTPEEAMIALKADAADRGANALINVRTERTTAGRCTAAADAVVAAPLPSQPRPDRPEAQNRS